MLVQVLGVYTFTKRVSLENFENKQRQMIGYSTVSHFNVVHIDCHLAAIRFVETLFIIFTICYLGSVSLKNTGMTVYHKTGGKIRGL